MLSYDSELSLVQCLRQSYLTSMAGDGMAAGDIVMIIFAAMQTASVNSKSSRSAHYSHVSRWLTLR